MKTISIFDIQEINNIFKNKNISCKLKLRDVCGSQTLFFVIENDEIKSQILCNIANEYLKEKFMEIYPSSINPYNVLIR